MIIPFLHFSPEEQAAIVHKNILELAANVRPSIKQHAGRETSFVGNVRLKVKNDASVCQVIANEEYHQDLGARSLAIGVESLVLDDLVQSYNDVDEEVVEDGVLTDFVVDVDGNTSVVNRVS